MAITLKNRHLAAKTAPQTNRIHTFLRRLRAGGRSNMYGAIPYLMNTFGLDREAAFRVICEWVDQQEDAGGVGGHPSSTR
jgi:hypothetical protein